MYAYVQMSNRVTLNVDAEDIPGSLLLADMVALGIVLAVSLLLYLPDCCRFEGARGRQALRRERNMIGFLLLATAVITSVTSRVRHLNMSTAHDESRVCGRRDSVDACPSQRIRLSQSYDAWLRNNQEMTMCWFNTSAANPKLFLWGEEYEYASTFFTVDFGDPDTYDAYPQYAPCFYYGCAEECLPDVRAHNREMLALEVIITVLAVAGIALSMCGKTNYAYSTLPKYEK